MSIMPDLSARSHCTLKTGFIAIDPFSEDSIIIIIIIIIIV